MWNYMSRQCILRKQFLDDPLTISLHPSGVQVGAEGILNDLHIENQMCLSLLAHIKLHYNPTLFLNDWNEVEAH